MGGDGSYTTEQLQHALDVSVAALNGVPYALAYGTLLGFIRNGQMIDGEPLFSLFHGRGGTSGSVLREKCPRPNL